MPKSYDGQLLLPFDFEFPVYERDTSTQTEQTYVDREKQINSFIRAGERLADVRRDEFEYPDGIIPDDVEPDPTTVLGFDFSDYSRISESLWKKARQAPKGVEGETGASVSPPESEDKKDVE